MKKILFSIPLILLATVICSIHAAGAIAGDIDGNGSPDISDARTTLRQSIELENEDITDEMLDMMDYNYDGVIDAFDAQSILNAAVGNSETKHYFAKEITVEPTCTKTGLYTRTCTECEEEETFTQEIPKLGHNLSLYKTIKKPTCSAEGTIEYKCKRCDKIIDKTFKADHTWKDATCTSPMTCTKCKITQGYSLGHSVRVGYCSVCGKYSSELEGESKIIISYLNSALKHLNTASELIEEGASSEFTNIFLEKCEEAIAELELAKTDFTDAYNTCYEETEFADAKTIIKNLSDTVKKAISNLENAPDNIKSIEKEYKSIIAEDSSKVSAKNKKIRKAITSILVANDGYYETINSVKYDLKDKTDKWKK